jgi:hypothetical protein
MRDDIQRKERGVEVKEVKEVGGRKTTFAS